MSYRGLMILIIFTFVKSPCIVTPYKVTLLHLALISVKTLTVVMVVEGSHREEHKPLGSKVQPKTHQDDDWYPKRE